MLKCDFHLHTSLDPCDTWIRHSPYELIDRAHELGFDVLCLSHHGKVLWEDDWFDYAQDKGILLIPGTEAFIGKKHVLLINFSQEEVERIHSFEDLERFHDDDHLIIASHPFFPSPDRQSMGRLVFHYARCLDALEYSSFFTRWWNANKRGVRAARRLRLPLVANTDCHTLEEFGRTYTLVEAEKTPRAIITAIKKGRVAIHAVPHTTGQLLRRTWQTVVQGTFRSQKRL